MQNDVFPILLGATEGAYALCRAFYHDYGICSLVIDKDVPPLFLHTKAAAACSYAGLGNPHIFERVLEDVYEKGRGKSLLLIPATEEYLSLTLHFRDRLEKMFLLPHLPSLCKEQPLAIPPSAVVFLYCSASGERRILYADVCAASSRQVLGVCAADLPKDVEASLLSFSSLLSRGCYLFYLFCSEEGYSFRQEASPLHPLMAFVTALDASIPEWMISETVLAQPLPPVSEDIRGVFTLFPMRKTIPFLSSADKKKVKQLHRRRLSTALYCQKGEARSSALAHVFRLLSRASLQKNEKSKK